MKKNKVILIVLDGLSNGVAVRALGCVHGLIEAKIARHQVLCCELPSMSRPLYETILTGKKPYESGIYTNSISRLSKEKSIFHYACEAGLVTAAAAYHWVSELYNQSPYDVFKHRHQHDESKPIKHGIFYHQDDYPDEALFEDAEYLRTAFDPDVMLIHPMGIDNAGHRFGVHSPEYMRQVRHSDAILGAIVPQWLAEGYQIMITADHGMNEDKSHGGMADVERIVPLYAIGDAMMAAIPEGSAKQVNIIDYLRCILNC